MPGLGVTAVAHFCVSSNKRLYVSKSFLLAADVTNDLKKTKEEKAVLQTGHDEVKQNLTHAEKKLHSESTCRSRYEKTLESISHTIGDVLPKADVEVLPKADKSEN